MAPFTKQCVSEGCAEQPCHGIKRGDGYIWACPEHKHLLGKEAAPPPSVSKPKRDLFDQP